jgi:hypothetical protein
MHVVYPYGNYKHALWTDVDVGVREGFWATLRESLHRGTVRPDLVLWWRIPYVSTKMLAGTIIGDTWVCYPDDRPCPTRRTGGWYGR